MSGRDMYRNVLRGSHCNSPQLGGDMSPISNLAFSLLGTSLSQTPRKRLSLHSNMSDTPQSCHNETSQQSPSILQDTGSSDSSSSYCEDSSLSPHRLSSSRNKENFPSPYYSPSRSSSVPARSRCCPLQEVQNTVSKSLTISPRKKMCKSPGSSVFTNLQMVSPSKRIFRSPQKPSPPDDFDTNSQDSGYSESGKKLDDVCFSVPISCAPRKLNLDLSPPKSRVTVSPVRSGTYVSSSLRSSIFAAATSTPITSSNSTEGSCPFRKFSSLSNGDEDDAMLRDLMDEQTPQEEQPMGLSNLLSAPIQPPSLPASSALPQVSPFSSSSGRPSIRRCLSMVDTTPNSSRVSCVTTQTRNTSTFKRPDPPCDLSSPIDCKRRRLEGPCLPLSPLASNAATTTGSNKIRSPLAQRQVSAPQPSTSQTVKPKLLRSHSESHVSIMKALNKSTGHGDLIGDFSKPWLLPTLDGKHPDLKSISVDTLAEVLKGKYSSQVASCRVIDCRYPYEFEGGHILGAEMWHHPEMVAENLKAQKGSPVITNEEALRHILIFHCEFSAERGPKAQRLLREMDRTANKEHYPALHFPEIYLLEGGYKAFYEKYADLCTPNDYVRMLDSNHTEDLKHFRGKSKSWAAENKQSKSRNALPRPGLKRLGL